MIGPHRASRTKAAVGIPDQPNVFYIGAVNGGVWKTTDYGRTWTPIFDDQPTGSIGAIAIAPSNPNIIYVGSGEGLQRPDLSTGDGIYKSTDAGKTWTHLGLRDGQQIPQIVVDPRDPEPAVRRGDGPSVRRRTPSAACSGRPTAERRFKKSYTRMRIPARSTSCSIRSTRTSCTACCGRRGKGRGRTARSPARAAASSSPPTAATRGAKSARVCRRSSRTDSVASASPSRRACRRACSRRSARRADRGLYRSDDAGENWYSASSDTRVTSRESDFAEVKVDPKNPDIVYTASVVTWKSTDGGKTFKALRGAPGGDDYHRIWINPINPNIILIASDQGAIVTVNGGETWSSWYNQPTASFYHVTTDNAFPYRVCGGQQESGSACVRSRGDDGRITFANWHPVGVEEYGYAAPDPLDPDIVYGGKVTRYDRRTGEVQQVGPRVGRGGGADYRTLRTAPLVFSTVDPHALFFASNVVWKTTNGGKSWTQISPDLTRTDSIVPPSVGIYASQPAARARHGGVVYTVAPSYVDAKRIWAGHRRRADSHDGRRRRALDGRHAAGAARTSRGARSRSWTPGGSTRAPPTPRSTRSGSTISGRTSFARTTAARRGRRS